MSDLHIMLNQRSREEEALFKLDRWLSYEVRSGWALVILFWMPAGIVMTMLYGLIAVFLPLIAMQLYRAKWLKTVTALVLMCLMGFLIPRSIEMDVRMMAWVYAAGMFVPFYFFCWILRWVVSEKVGEIKAMETLARMKQTV